MRKSVDTKLAENLPALNKMEETRAGSAFEFEYEGVKGVRAPLALPAPLPVLLRLILPHLRAVWRCAPCTFAPA